ncbi:type III-B CRISPR module RAMP protein Cmr6 [Planifilum fimeticola]
MSRNQPNRNNNNLERMIFHPCDTADVFRQLEGEKFGKPIDHLWYVVNYHQQKNTKKESKYRLYPVKGKSPLSQTHRKTYSQVLKQRREALALLSRYQRVKILHGRPTGKAFPGLGAAHVRESSLTIHPVYGVPYLPGSSIKGVVRHWALEAFFEGSEKAYETALKGEAGETKARHARAIRDVFGDQEHSGAVQFHDAFACEEVCLKPDVLTVHFRDYYQQGKPPTDRMDPVPNEFYGVEAPYFEFVITLAGQNHSDFSLEGEDLLEVTGTWLKQALTEMGIGAKTTSGYGCFDSFVDRTENTLQQGFQSLESREEKRKAQEESLRREREEREQKEAWARKWAAMSEEERLCYEIGQLKSDNKEDREKSKSELYERVVAQAEQGNLGPARVLRKYWEKTGDWHVKKKKKKQYEKVQILLQLLGES